MANMFGNGLQSATAVVIGCVLFLIVERLLQKELVIMADNEIIKIKDNDSDETVEYEECSGCGGMGGYDASRNCEEYDDWHNCEECEGRGYVEHGFYERRDAFMPGD